MKSIGQLLFTGISGLALTSEESKFIEEEEIGGVLLFSRNYESPGQLAELINSIQNLRQEYPLFIAVDQEGGRVQRFKEPFTVFPSAKDFSSLKSPKLVFEAYQIIATELKACGVNVNFAPCVDIVTTDNNKVIGDRSFGDNPADVERYASAAIRGLQTMGILACPKHFPGHGMSSKDSHDVLPRVNKSLDELLEWDIIPFVKAIKSRSEFMMMAHLQISHFDKELPCSLAKSCYDYLRNDLKYSKIILTDDMQMGAILNNFSVGSASVKALSAGTDMLEYKDFEMARESLDEIKKAVSSSELKDQDMAQKLRRVKDCKKRNLKEYSPVFIPSISKVFSKKAHQIFREDLLSKITKIK
ncbi:beta-N-acetylhexosaminidase [bacterium]|nr:beta-N-acetylhexosaminidase [bacterium]